MSLYNLAGRFLRVLYHTRVVSDKRNKNEIIILLASTEATLLYPIHTARRKATRQFCRVALRRAV